MNQYRIPCAAYQSFCRCHFSAAGKKLEDGLVPALYERMDGITFYMQKVMNLLYMRTKRGVVTLAMLDDAIAFAFEFAAATYEDLLYQ